MIKLWILRLWYDHHMWKFTDILEYRINIRYSIMISVLTGDIVNSRKAKSPKEWQDILQHALRGVTTTNDWEIFRGDSFQLELDKPEKSLKAAIYIKACIKTIKGLDVRIAIGIGEKNYVGKKVTESFGDAYFFSGEKFESLKQEKLNLAIKTPDEDFNEIFNILFNMSLAVMDNWTPNSAALVKALMEHDHLSQKDLGAILGIGQSSVSERYNRAYIAEIMTMNDLFVKKVNKLTHSDNGIL